MFQAHFIYQGVKYLRKRAYNAKHVNIPDFDCFIFWAYTKFCIGQKKTNTSSHLNIPNEYDDFEFCPSPPKWLTLRNMAVYKVR